MFKGHCIQWERENTIIVRAMLKNSHAQAIIGATPLHFVEN
jgi:hypothetical protein